MFFVMTSEKHLVEEFRMRFLIAAGIVIMMETGPAIAGVEKKIDLSEVPERVMEVLNERFGKAVLLTANTETEEDGSVVYEIQGKLSDGHLAEFDVYPDGKIEEIEVIFPIEMVPGAILKALDSKMSGFVPTKIEATHSASMKVIGYEFEGTLNGQKMDLEVSADGRTIIVSDQ